MSDLTKRKAYRTNSLQNAIWLIVGLSLACVVTIGAEEVGGSADSKNSNPALGNWKPFTEPSRGFDPKANLDLVPDAEFVIGRDAYGPIVRVNMLKIADWLAVPGIRKVWKAHDKTPGSGGTFSNLVLSEVVDVDGRNRFHAFCYINWGKSIARYDEKGACLWVSDELPLRAGDESRLPVLDVDADGTLEVISTQRYREKGGGAIVCLNGDNGTVKWQRDFEGEYFKGLENPMAVGHFTDKKKFDIVARFDRVVYCLNSRGILLWKHKLTDDYEYGHELYWYDVDGDGIDEIFVSTQRRMTAFRGDGTVIWQDKTSRNHSDFIVCGDVDADGRIEVVYDHDGCGGNGPVYIADALTGKLKSTIDYHLAGLNHAQGGVVAKFRSDLPGMQVFMNEKINGICMFDGKGKLLWKNDSAGSLCSSGDWDGDGVLEAMCFALGTNRDGIFSVWDGHGRRKYAISFLPSPLYAPGISHAGPAGRIGRLLQSDMTGDGKADVVMSFGRWGSSPDQYLFIMGEPEDGLAMFAGQSDATEGKAIFETWQISPGNTTYYVDAAGDDVNPGTAPDKAWKTLARVNALKLAPGDKILLKVGCEFAGPLAPQGTGAEGKPIVIDKYGDGATPVIAGKGQVENAIRLHNQQHWEIRNLTVTNTDGGGWDDEGRKLRRAIYVTATDVGDINHIYLQNLEIRDVRGMYRFEGNQTNGGIICQVLGDKKPTRFVDLRIEGCVFRTKSIDRYPVVVTSSWGKQAPGEVVYRNNTLDHAGRAHIVIPADQWPRKLVYYFDPEVRKVFPLDKTAAPVSPFTGRVGCEDIFSEMAARLIRSWSFFEATRYEKGRWLFKMSAGDKDYSLWSTAGMALDYYGEIRALGFEPPWIERENKIMDEWIGEINKHLDAKTGLLNGPNYGAAARGMGYLSNKYDWSLRNRVFMADRYTLPPGALHGSDPFPTKEAARKKFNSQDWVNNPYGAGGGMGRYIKSHTEVLRAAGKDENDEIVEMLHKMLDAQFVDGHWGAKGSPDGNMKVLATYSTLDWPIPNHKKLIDYTLSFATDKAGFAGSGCHSFNQMYSLIEARRQFPDGYRGDEIDKYTARTFINFLNNWNEKMNFYFRGDHSNWNAKHNNGVPLFMAHLILDLPIMRASTIYNWRETPVITRNKKGKVKRNKVIHYTKGFNFHG